ncbi:MAG: TetR/AcrR family transcriptional regulator [Oscillospiraceae bacterium]|nr:TetR/AcrR family transcriptional regulator [Oscillospiraceae bacterium]
MGKRQEAALETRQKLIDAVKKLSETKAYHEMSIDDITQTAGVAKGTFYTYFKRREDIISVIAYEDFDKTLKGISDNSIDVAERIAQFLNDSANIIEDNSLQIAQQWYRSVTSPLNGDTLGMDKISYDRNFIESCLRCAVDNNSLQSDTPVASLSLQIISAYYGAVALWCMSDGTISQTAIIKDFCKDSLSNIINAYRR